MGMPGKQMSGRPQTCLLAAAEPPYVCPQAAAIRTLRGVIHPGPAAVLRMPSGTEHATGWSLHSCFSAVCLNAGAHPKLFMKQDQARRTYPVRRRWRINLRGPRSEGSPWGPSVLRVICVTIEQSYTAVVRLLDGDADHSSALNGTRPNSPGISPRRRCGRQMPQ
jgi:hypothetical protein